MNAIYMFGYREMLSTGIYDLGLARSAFFYTPLPHIGETQCHPPPPSHIPVGGEIMFNNLLSRYGECRVYPAVDVHDTATHALRHTVDGVANKLF